MADKALTEQSNMAAILVPFRPIAREYVCRFYFIYFYGFFHRYPKNIDGYFSSDLSEYHPLFHVLNVAIFRDDVWDFLLLFIEEVY